MNIAPINNANTNMNTNFSGKVIAKGKWFDYMKNSFLENPELKELAKGEYNIVGNMSAKRASSLSNKHYPGQPLFKLKITAEKENPTFLDRIKTFLGLDKSYKVTRHYHSESTTEMAMQNRINGERIKKALGL